MATQLTTGAAVTTNTHPPATSTTGATRTTGQARTAGATITEHPRGATGTTDAIKRRPAGTTITEPQPTSTTSSLSQRAAINTISTITDQNLTETENIDEVIDRRPERTQNPGLPQLMERLIEQRPKPVISRSRTRHIRHRGIKTQPHIGQQRPPSIQIKQRLPRRPLTQIPKRPNQIRTNQVNNPIQIISLGHRRSRQRRHPKRQKRPHRTTGSRHPATPAANHASQTTTPCAVLLVSHAGLPILRRTHVGDVFSDQVFELFNGADVSAPLGKFGRVLGPCRSAFRR
ncbi:hypothetical protein MSEN_29140 [Mycolicibacter senuensis]|uniref:Uncharacterized protein n=1 Tax=Mycolicibacter senuensis TaxID=386913 RepID=A0A7I9XMN1_9MYCO|nr:hypothetical protein MSEN_29140 [Mycolicibacter senuensis]